MKIMKIRKIAYALMIACLALIGFAGCDKAESDDLLVDEGIEQEGLFPKIIDVAAIVPPTKLETTDENGVFKVKWEIGDEITTYMSIRNKGLNFRGVYKCIAIEESGAAKFEFVSAVNIDNNQETDKEDTYFFESATYPVTEAENSSEFKDEWPNLLREQQGGSDPNFIMTAKRPRSSKSGFEFEYETAVVNLKLPVIYTGSGRTVEFEVTYEDGDNRYEYSGSNLNRRNRPPINVYIHVLPNSGTRDVKITVVESGMERTYTRKGVTKEYEAGTIYRATIDDYDDLGSVPVTSVELNASSMELGMGEYRILRATVLPSNASNKNMTWSSSNPSVAKVESGKVTALKRGTATITVKTESGNKTATCNVTVTETNPEGKLYRIGDLYPNDYNPIGIVYKVNAFTSMPTARAISGMIVSLDKGQCQFKTVSNGVTEFENKENGRVNMATAKTKDSDFSGYPAMEWVDSKNAPGTTYSSSAKGVWYLPAAYELRSLFAGMCDLVIVEYDPGKSDDIVEPWSLLYPMPYDNATKEQAREDFDDKIVSAGGTTFGTSYKILSSSDDHNVVYSLSPNGRVGQGNKVYNYQVRAVMAF